MKRPRFFRFPFEQFPKDLFYPLNKESPLFELALDYYNQYLNIFPEEIKIYEEIANLYERTNNFKKAKKIYEKGLTIEPDNISLMQNLIYIDEDLGKTRLDELEILLNNCQCSDLNDDNTYNILDIVLLVNIILLN